jgi:hydroxymethylglutaryl-CoA lyase
MSETLKIYEVGPRDGLQNEAKSIETAGKLQLIDSLIASGLSHLEITSFVHPKTVPQMADADEVMRASVEKNQYAQLVGLVFNQRGYDRAIEAGCRAMAFGVAVSETFSRHNTRTTPDEALETARRLAAQAKRDGVWTRAYVMTAWVCPYEGPVSPHRAMAMAEEVWQLGVDELAIADTIGHAHPVEVGRLMEQLGRRLDMDRLAVHLHDTQAIGLANATTALQAGVRIFDSSIGGLGGCPFAPGAAGNLATEDLVFLAYKMGFGTGVDFKALWEIVYKLENLVGRSIGGRIRQWWESHLQIEPTVAFN